LPYTPVPPTPQSNANSQTDQIPGNPTNSNGAYTEMQAKLDPIDGSVIQFGTENIIRMDPNGPGQDLTRSHNHILGSGRLSAEVRVVLGVGAVS